MLISSAYPRVLQLLLRNQWLANGQMVASCPVLDPKHVEWWRAEVMTAFCSHGDWAFGAHSRLAFTSHSQSVEVSLLPWPSALRSDWVTVQATAHPSSYPWSPEEGSPSRWPRVQKFTPCQCPIALAQIILFQNRDSSQASCLSLLWEPDSFIATSSHATSQVSQRLPAQGPTSSQCLPSELLPFYHGYRSPALALHMHQYIGIGIHDIQNLWLANG